MTLENKRLLIEDEYTEHLFKELAGENVTVSRSYTSAQQAIDLINQGGLDAIVTGWKIRHSETDSQELVAPQAVKAAREKKIPIAIYSSHPDALRSQIDAKIVDKTKAEIADLRLMLRELLEK